PAVATPPGGASARGLARGTCPARGEELRHPDPPTAGPRDRRIRNRGTRLGQPPERKLRRCVRARWRPESQASRDTRQAHSYLFRLNDVTGEFLPEIVLA